MRLHDLVYSGRLAVPPSPESYAIRRLTVGDRPILVVAGSDERGLMYGLVELARRINRLPPGTLPARALADTREETAKPEVPVRGMVQFLHSADLEREWYYDPRYWEAYLAMLARDRFNSFNLVFAHQTDYLAPPYPFLFTVEEYPGVRVPGLSEADQKRNLETLQMISRMARERGLDFVMGIWEHRAWRRGQKSMVDGLTDAILPDYARRAMEKLLRLCPDIGGIQLRVNTESGIDIDRQTAFYGAVFAGMKAAGRPVLLDLRGWGALPATIDAAVASGLPMRLSMKYWAEFMGMPYQAAQMLPSYSYADFLHHPRPYPVFYQVWSLGSHRLFPWGSVDWVRRFAPTTLLDGGLGFETCAPLSQKGFGNPPGSWRIFTSREREYYTWEFERYWLYYLLYGRLTYDPATPEEVWLDELGARYGRDGARPVFEAFQAASQVVPFLVSYRLSNPNMYIWPEKQMGGVLDFYLEVKPADPARVASFQEHVARRLDGVTSAKMSPEEAAARLTRMAEATERALARADAALASEKNKEYAANRIDLAALALLARYHAAKIRAAGNLALFYASGDEAALVAAKSLAAAALEVWRRLVRLTDGVYYPQMVFGPRDVGHWKDNLVFVRHDVSRLEEVSKLLDAYGLFDLGLDFGPKVTPRNHPYEPAYADTYSVERRFQPLDPETTYRPERRYGWLGSGDIRASEPMRIPYTSLEGDNLDDLALPSEVLYRDFLKGTAAARLRLDLPDGEYRVTAIVANQPELATGAFEIRAGAGALRYAVAETGDKEGRGGKTRARVRARGGKELARFRPGGRAPRPPHRSHSGAQRLGGRAAPSRRHHHGARRSRRGRPSVLGAWRDPPPRPAACRRREALERRADARKEMGRKRAALRATGARPPRRRDAFARAGGVHDARRARLRPARGAPQRADILRGGHRAPACLRGARRLAPRARPPPLPTPDPDRTLPHARSGSRRRRFIRGDDPRRLHRDSLRSHVLPRSGRPLRQRRLLSRSRPHAALRNREGPPLTLG
ncbi:MAG: hypothetical protein DMG07_21290 [Acidobacteria bacterium]|nr:MAG: hypothetical protein DMG07_21290 [Acidobacteriota bacterium]